MNNKSDWFGSLISIGMIITIIILLVVAYDVAFDGDNSLNLLDIFTKKEESNNNYEEIGELDTNQFNSTNSNNVEPDNTFEENENTNNSNSNADNNKILTKKNNNQNSDTIIEVIKVSLNQTSKTLNEGSTTTLTATISPSNATNKNIIWSTSNSKVATVSNGKVTAKSAGTAKITATSSNGKTATCTITVNKVNNTIEVTKVSLNQTSKTLNEGSTTTLTATISPSNATNKNIIWSTSNSKVATVSNGKVTAKSAGTAKITATSNNGKTATCTITVNKVNNTIEVTKIELSTTAKTVYTNNPNNAFPLVATVYPSNATNKSVIWTSSNTSVATVSNGVVTPKGAGTATIKATSGSVKATMTITVKTKVIIEIGASQSQRFIKYSANSYTRGNNKYTTEAGTLVHIAQSGAEMSWQYAGEGYTRTDEELKKYASKKQYVEFYLYYLLIGNTIKDSTCTTINNTPSTYKNPLNGYNNITNTFKNNGYNVKTYVVSMHPVKPGEANAEGHKVVSNKNAKYCDINYRSNWKYNLFNNKVYNTIKNSYSQLTYVDTFNQIMDTSGTNESNRTYKYKVSYTCEGDGIHWDDSTAKMYLKLMLDTANNNL